MFWMRSPSQRIFGEASEKNLYLSQLIILDTLEKCLAGVSSVLQTPPHHPKKKQLIKPALSNILKSGIGVQQLTIHW